MPACCSDFTNKMVEKEMPIMTPIEFKRLFNHVAMAYGWKGVFGGWFYETPECLGVLELQRSNFGNYFELNIKLYIHGLFGETPVPGKNLVAKETGDVFRRPPGEYDDAFNFGIQMAQNERQTRLETFFHKFLAPFFNEASTKRGILRLDDSGQIFLLPAVKIELKQLAID